MKKYRISIVALAGIIFVSLLTNGGSLSFNTKVHAASVNLALGKAATATDSNSAGETPPKAVDDNLTTHWCSTTTGDRWLRIDLGVATTFNRWTVKHAQTGGEDPNFNTSDFKLQISSDGSNFTDVDTVTGNTAAITNRSISSTNARYIRLYITKPNQLSGTGSNIVRIREFELYNDNIPSSGNYYYFDLENYLNTTAKCKYPIGSNENTPKGRYIKLGINLPNQDAVDEIVRINELELYYNIALGKTATATNSASSTETADKAVDGSLTTQWRSTTAGARWLCVDLGTSKTITHWVVRHAQAAGDPSSYNTKDFKLQVSNDGTNFTDVDNVAGNTAAVTERAIAGSTGRYFRLYITTPNQTPGDNTVRIKDFELYETGNLLSSYQSVTATDSNSPGETPDKVLDGAVNTHWCSTTTGYRWLIVDLGSAKKFNRWVVKHAQTNGESPTLNTRSYSISVSDDNVIYTGLDGVGSNSAATTDRMITTQKYTRYAYDFVKMAATVQGIINRDGPKIFYKFESSEQVAKSHNFHPDTFWLNQLTQSGQILSGKTQVTVTNFYTQLLDPFLYRMAGLILWDEGVPATSNVASTVAGVENLIPVRYDTSVGSVYNELLTNTSLDVGVSLANRFTGSGTIWNTSIPSTGSKKNDAYKWAKAKYVDTCKVNANLMQYGLDAWSGLRDTSNNIMYSNLFNRYIINQDYYIKNKAFFFDLQPGNDRYPNDDLTQTLGTDYNTLHDILDTMYANAGGSIITIGGFTPWTVKYTSEVDPNGYGPVDSEWKMTDLASQHNAQIDADAPDLVGLANASLYSQVALSSLWQNNDKGNNGMIYDATKRYIMFYMGDYDSAAWTAGNLPAIWDKANGRGRIPLTWSMDPALSARIPMMYNYQFATMTAKDYFVAGDNGAGYLNAIQLPSVNLDNWKQYNRNYFSQFDLTISGFVITGYSTNLLNNIQQAYSYFAPDGVGINSAAQTGYYNSVPFLSGVRDLNWSLMANSKYWVEKGLKDYINSNPNQHFYAFRSILCDPDVLADAVAEYQADYPQDNLVVVDPYTFFRLYKAYNGWGTTLFTSGLESGQTQPTWTDSVEYSANVTGYSGGNPECKIRTGEQSYTGNASLMAAGTDNSTNVSYCYMKVFDVNIAVTSDTRLSYWSYPLQENGRYVAVDLVCTDGTTLRDTASVDFNMTRMHPAFAKGAVNRWTQIRCDIGQWLNGKTIDKILIGYDQGPSTGQYKTYIDDIIIYR